jgi:hypothetical protein
MAIIPLGGPCSWHGAELQRDQSWLREWPQHCLDTFEQAIDQSERDGLQWHQATRDQFSLRAIADDIAVLAQFLEDERGVLKLTGFPIDNYTTAQQKTLFFGLGSWLGRPVFQTARGELMGEICDEGPDVGSKRGQLVDADGKSFPSSRARAQSSGLLRWHTDRTDVVGLLCAGQPARGGTSRIVSAVAVHDAMVACRPDLAKLLYENLERSHLGEEAGGATKTYAIPVWGVTDGKFATHYSRTYVEAAQKLPDVTPLSDAHWEALDLLAELAEELCLEMEFSPGDMQFINNHVVYHARGEFEDDVAAGKRRLLYRVWLSMENSRPLPDSYDVLFGTTAAGANRGGIRQSSGAASPA